MITPDKKRLLYARDALLDAARAFARRESDDMTAALLLAALKYAVAAVGSSTASASRALRGK